MRKFYFVLALILLTASCTKRDPLSTPTASEAPIYSDDSETYNDEEEVFPVWAGPGWYGGVYLNNEDEYRNHYNNQRQGGQYNRGGDGQHRGGEGQHRGGEGRGGGGHGGGGHR